MGANPVARLLLSGSTLYGTTLYGGDSIYGTVFQPEHQRHPVFACYHNFTGSEGQEGANPLRRVGVVGGQLFGTTQYGDSGDIRQDGTVFRVDINGNNFTQPSQFCLQRGILSRRGIGASGQHALWSTAYPYGTGVPD